MRIGLPTLLVLLFIALKLTGHITWSWGWVLSPLWFSLGILFAAFGLGLLIELASNRRK